LELRWQPREPQWIHIHFFVPKFWWRVQKKKTALKIVLSLAALQSPSTKLPVTVLWALISQTATVTLVLHLYIQIQLRLHEMCIMVLSVKANRNKTAQ
jgi:hypothetical protein